MRDFKDAGTGDMFGWRSVGRPRSKTVMSGAQRQAKYRQAEIRRQEERMDRFSHLSDVTIARYMSDADQDPDFRKDLWLEFGRRFGWK